MATLPDRALALFFDLYERLPRQGPGNEAATRRALDMLGPLPAAPRVADLGCGGGASSRVLAAATGGSVVAIDIHAPFLAPLRGAAACAGLILPVVADMAEPPLAPASLDLLWSEGAIYQIGFATGLARWRALLRPGGRIAVSEASWLSPAPDEEVRGFWATAYPAMTGIAENEAAMAASGFRVLGSFALPAECWLDSYYHPLEREFEPFLARHPGDPAAAAIVEEARTEIALYRRHGDSYGYVFYLGEAI